MSIDYSSDNESFFSIPSDDNSFSSIPCLSNELTTHFSGVSGNFNMVHINAQSIPAHFPDMLANFDGTNIHAILISESWLKPCLPSTSYSLPGFTLIRNDRAMGGGGGVAIYLRSHITHKVVHESPQPPPLQAGEHLFLEIELHHVKILIGVYYCPSLHINYFSSLENILESIIPCYHHSIIMGDFNTCLIKQDHRSSSLLSLMNSNNMTVLPLNATHHFPNCTPSLLDLIFVSSFNHVAKHGQCPADSFSYHDLIFLSYKIRPPKAKPKTLLLRNFGGMDLNALREDASNIDWSPILTCTTVDDQVNIFSVNIIELYDRHAPVRPVKVKHRPSPWMTDEIKYLIKRKAMAKFKFKCRPTDANRKNYVATRNHCNKVCRNAQRQHIHNSVQNKDPAKVWKFLRSMGVGKNKQHTIPKNLDIDSLNQHFTASSNFDRIIKSITLNSLSAIPTPSYSSFFFNHFTVCDVKRSILSITSNSVGSDCISRNMITPILDTILPIITFIFNHSVSSGVFPSKWKDAQVIPLPKKPSPTSFSEYRPISILPFLSKVFERLIHSQLSNFLLKNKLHNPLQSGFRAGHSTTTTLVNITDDIRAGMEIGNLTVLALLDFSNAFNTVDFDILLGILCSLNISPSVIDWFHSYLYGRRQRICIEEITSSWCETTAGVPQGGVLSPLLFSIFINSISYQLTSSYHLYADDLQIYRQGSPADLTEVVDAINQDLCRITDWSRKHGLQVNPAKTQVMVVGSPRMISRLDWSTVPQVSFNSIYIPYSDYVRNLGLLIDNKLSWTTQLQDVSRKLYASAGSLRRLRNFLPITTKIALVQSLLFPILDYADVSYLDLTEDQLDKLERLQNFCIRFIYGLRKYDHVSEFRIKLKWLPIRLRRNTHILSLLYNVLFNPSTPFYLKNRFEFLCDSHVKFLRSSENLRLKMPSHSTKFTDKSFTVQAARLWNALPVEIRRAQSLQIFQGLVKQHYLSQI